MRASTELLELALRSGLKVFTAMLSGSFGIENLAMWSTASSP